MSDKIRNTTAAYQANVLIVEGKQKSLSVFEDLVFAFGKVNIIVGESLRENGRRQYRSRD